MGLAAIALSAGCNRPPAASASSTGDNCLPGQRAFLQARLRGAIESQLDWRGDELQCEGGARPDGKGIRVSVAGPLEDSRRLRFVFGIAAAPMHSGSGPWPTNVTMLLEGENRIYATLGDDKCSVDALVQQPLPDDKQAYRVALRGYCVDAATAIGGDEKLYLERFDVAAIARFE